MADRQHQENEAREIVVRKRDARDQYPRNQGRNISYEDKQRLCVLIPHGADAHVNHSRKAAPAYERIHEAAEGRPQVARLRLEIVQYRPNVSYPVVPVRGIGMLRIDSLVISQHEL